VRAGKLALWLIGTRALALAAMVLGTFWPAPKDDLHWIGQDGSLWFQQLPWRVLDVWGRWDTAHYLRLAAEGYQPLGADELFAYQAAYFPFFPVLMRGVSELTFGLLSPYLAGVLLAQVMLVLAVVYFDKLLRRDESPEFSLLAVSCLLAYPGSHWLSCVYPESTALFLAVFAVYCARAGLPVVAGLACMLAAVTRSSGWVICFPVLYELTRPRELAPFTLSLSKGVQLHPRVLVLLLPFVSLGALMGLHQQVYGDPLYFIHVQAGWGRKPSLPFLPLFDFSLSLDYHLFTVAALAATVYGFKKKERAGYLSMAAINVLIPLSTGMLRGIHRYMASNFPLFVFLARAVEKRPRWKLAWYVVGLSVMAVFAFRWGQGKHPN
jgi:hypothetical protein